ncbi:uncharacterized protein [Medicago truncatula]|uniref:uncharacterized protein n=1 Tax=Medicago truncatula TaxID=3880 RepID=UPI000D2F3DFD|nr:uncharacterized protein LOC11422047 [Medicago truncatula]
MWDALSDWRNKFSFVDGRMEVPDEDDLNQKEWERCNNLVHSWIMNSVSDSIAQGIVFFENVVDVWCDLKEQFSKAENPKLRQESKTVTDYFGLSTSGWLEYQLVAWKL